MTRIGNSARLAEILRGAQDDGSETDQHSAVNNQGTASPEEILRLRSG